MTLEKLRQKLEIALVKSGRLTHTDLAKRMGMSDVSVHKKYHKPYMTTRDLDQICDAIDYDWTVTLISRRDGDTI